LGLWVEGCGMSVVGYGMGVVGCEMRVVGYGMGVVGYGMGDEESWRLGLDCSCFDEDGRVALVNSIGLKIFCSDGASGQYTV